MCFSHSFICASTAVLALTAASASASLIADSFISGAGGYSSATGNTLQGQGPSNSGFTSGWTLGTGSTVFHVDSSTYGLTSPGAYSTGGSVGFSGATGDTAQSVARAVAVPTAGVYYMSGIYERGNSSTITAGSYALMGWGNTVLPNAASSGSTLQGVYVGFTQTAATNSSKTLDDYGSLIIRTRQRVPQSAGSSTFVEQNVDTLLVDGQALSTYNQKYFVVTKLTLNGNADELDYWLNPTTTSSDAAMSSTSALYGAVTIDSVGSASDLSQLTMAESGYNSSFSFDEPRLATTLSDLAAVPEPASLAVLALGLAMPRRWR